MTNLRLKRNPLVCPSTHYARRLIQNSQMFKPSFCCEILYMHMPDVNTLFCSLYSLYKSDAMFFLCVIIITTSDNAIKKYDSKAAQVVELMCHTVEFNLYVCIVLGFIRSW